MLFVLILQLALNFNSISSYNLEAYDDQYIGFILPSYMVYNSVVYKGISAVIMIVSAFFLLLLNILVFTQILNFLSNQTMNERYGNKGGANKNKDNSFASEDAQAALLHDSSMDSTIQNKGSSKCRNF